MDSTINSQSFIVNIQDIKSLANNLIIEINIVLKDCFNGKKPKSPKQPIKKKLFWKKLNDNIIFILVGLPILTAIITTIGVWVWQSELLALINAFNAIPPVIEKKRRLNSESKKLKDNILAEKFKQWEKIYKILQKTRVLYTNLGVLKKRMEFIKKKKLKKCSQDYLKNLYKEVKNSYDKWTKQSQEITKTFYKFSFLKDQY